MFALLQFFFALWKKTVEEADRRKRRKKYGKERRRKTNRRKQKEKKLRKRSQQSIRDFLSRFAYSRAIILVCCAGCRVARSSELGGKLPNFTNFSERFLTFRILPILNTCSEFFLITEQSQNGTLASVNIVLSITFVSNQYTSIMFYCNLHIIDDF